MEHYETVFEQSQTFMATPSFKPKALIMKRQLIIEGVWWEGQEKL